MIHYLSKFLVLPFYPAGLSLVLIAFAIGAMKFRHTKTAIWIASAAGLLLLAFSMQPVAHLLMRSLESRYAPATTFPSASAIVLLGGSEVPRLPPRVYDETNCAGDRIMHAARLFKQGYAPRIVVSGGKIEFVKSFPGSEAAASFRLLTGLFGIDSASILIDDQAKNTYFNGVYTKRILDSLGIGKDIILVTSALHMPRSVAIFRKLGFTVYPAPTDFYEDEQFQYKPISFFPHEEALFKSRKAIHELYGLISYKVLGWI